MKIKILGMSLSFSNKQILSLLISLVLLGYALYSGKDLGTLVPNSTNSTDQAGRSSEYAVVSRVIDGDTVDLADGRRVRYVGINTPEIARGKQKGECFGQEALERNKDLVEGKEVRLERDTSEKDKYGRWLYLVFVGDVSVEETLTREGFAKEMTIKPDVKYAENIKNWVREAQEKGLGVWACSK